MKPHDFTCKCENHYRKCAKINKTVRLDVACLRQVIDKIDYLTPVKDKQTFS